MANLQRVTYRGWPKSMVGGSVLHVEGSSRRWKDVVTSGKIYIHVVLICMANSYLDRCRCGAGFCCDCGKLLTACQCGPIAYEDPRDDPIHDEHFWGEHYRYTDMSEFAADDFVCEGYNQTFVRNQIVSCTQCHHLFLCAGCKPHWTVESVTKHLSEHFHEKHSSWAEVVLTEGERNGCAGCHRGGKELEARCSDCGLQFCSRCRSIWTASEDQERIGRHFKEGHDLYWDSSGDAEESPCRACNKVFPNREVTECYDCDLRICVRCQTGRYIYDDDDDQDETAGEDEDEDAWDGHLDAGRPFRPAFDRPHGDRGGRYGRGRGDEPRGG